MLEQIELELSFDELQSVILYRNVNGCVEYPYCLKMTINQMKVDDCSFFTIRDDSLIMVPRAGNSFCALKERLGG